jgi:hypothetical protein
MVAARSPDLRPPRLQAFLISSIRIDANVGRNENAGGTNPLTA